MATTQNILYSWAFEDKKDRSPLWYIIALACVIWLVIWGFLTGQYGMSIVVMLLGGLFYFLENNAEDTIQVQISELWISISTSFYDYARMSWYNLVYDGSQAVYLRLHMKKRGPSYLNLKIDNTIAGDIRPILSPYLEENGKQDVTLLEKITHLLKL